MAARATIADVIADSALLAPWFSGPSWDTWRAVLKAAFALRMTKRERSLFRAVAERDPPRRPVSELVAIAGRRAGKDSIASAIATYAAAFVDYGGRLRPGERAVVMCLAVDRAQAKIVLGYVRAYFEAVPMLRAMVTRETLDGLELNNGVDVVVATNDFRAVRGRTIAAAIFDEAAFWADENSAAPDTETYAAVLPGLATLTGAILVIISSPYRKAGLLYEKHRDAYAKNDPDVLVVKGPSTAFNPTLDPRIIEAALKRDPVAASAEWLGEFRNDIGAYVSREVIDAATVAGRHEIAPARDAMHYRAFVDPAGGSGSDSMTLAIAHRDAGGRGVGVLDAVRERPPPFSPDDVVQEFAELLKSYGVREVSGDRWGGDWPGERFRLHGINYVPADQPKSDIYRDFLPILNSSRAELLDHPRMAAQLAALERRTARGGRDSIDHPPGAHDDVANVAAGVLVAVAGRSDPLDVWRQLGAAA